MWLTRFNKSASSLPWVNKVPLQFLQAHGYQTPPLQFGDDGGGGLSGFNVSKHMFMIWNSEFGDLSILNGIWKRYMRPNSVNGSHQQTEVESEKRYNKPEKDMIHYTHNI